MRECRSSSMKILPPPSLPPSLPTGDGGKPAVIKSLKERFGYVDVVMVGDGATDMQVGREGGREGGERG